MKEKLKDKSSSSQIIKNEPVCRSGWILIPYACTVLKPHSSVT